MDERESHPRWWQAFVMRVVMRRPVTRLFSHVIHHLDRVALRLSGGRLTLTGLFTGWEIITLTTIGARSGQPRSVPLLALREGDDLVVIASNFGRASHPGWYHNLRENPEVTVASARGEARYTAREATGSERERYWSRATRRYPGYVNYQRWAGDRVIPVVVLSPAGNEPGAA
jgi:deazaflavin-dependent oxidoreductase (nitroreductase family)